MISLRFSERIGEVFGIHAYSIAYKTLTNLDSIVKFFGGDFDEVVHVYVVDEVGVYDEFKETVDNSFLNILDNYNASIEKSSDSVDDLKKEIIDKESSDIIINITNIDNPTYEKCRVCSQWVICKPEPKSNINNSFYNTVEPSGFCKIEHKYTWCPQTPSYNRCQYCSDWVTCIPV